MKTKDLMKKWGLSVISIFAGGLIIFLMLTFFNVSTEKTMEQFIHNNMDETNQAAVVSLNNNFNHFITMLEQQAQIFSMLENPTDEEIMSQLKNFAARENFKNAAIVMFDGTVYSSFRGIAPIDPNDSLPNLYSMDTTVSQPRVFHDGTLVVDISTPAYLNEINIGKLVVSLSSDYLAGMIFDGFQQGDAAFILMTQDGTVITRSSQRSSPLMPNFNIFDFYSSEDVEFIDGSGETLANDLNQNNSSWVKYTYQGDTSVGVSYVPFGINNWQLAIAVTGSTLFAQSTVIRNSALLLTLGIMAVVVAVSIFIIIQRIGEQKRIAVLKNTYSIAIRKTNDLFYEANIDNDMLIDYSEQKDKAIWKNPPEKYSNALEQIADVCAPEFRQGFLDTFLPQNIRIKMKDGISSINFEYKITPEEGDERWLSATFVPIDDGLNGTKLICMENDITEHMLMQEKLKRSATLDGLTGLFNKVTTQDYIDWFLEADDATGQHALVIMDIDHFKWINDHLGHAKGDEVLAEFAASLQTVFRKSDVIGRIGGDEFIVFLKDYGSVQLIADKMAVIKKVFHKDLCAPEDRKNHMRTSTSIGIALYDRDGKNFSELYQAADRALYASKNQGRDRYTFFQPEFD